MTRGVTIVAARVFSQEAMATLAYNKQGEYWIGKFQSMASPCEILIDSSDKQLATKLVEIAETEATRIEKKFSRYKTDNLIYKINHSENKPVRADEELANLLDYASQCYELSDGLFDITSGILRKVWHFDCTNKIPKKESVEALLPLIGWEKLSWQSPYIQLPIGMEIDLGGIGKEYAVDRTATLLRDKTNTSVLINYGGDLYSTGPRTNKHGWLVGIESFKSASSPKAEKLYELMNGGMATSGDVRRYLLKDGKRYSHILNPKTGWPVENAPHSITVASDSCTEAGILCTLGMLHGQQAETFLKAQNIKFWPQR